MTGEAVAVGGFEDVPVGEARVTGAVRTPGGPEGDVSSGRDQAVSPSAP